MWTKLAAKYSHQVLTTTYSASLVLFGCGLSPVVAQNQIAPAGGVVVSRGNDSLTIKAREGDKTFRVDKQTRIWRGGIVDLAQLAVGDRIVLTYHSDDKGVLIADSIDANIAHWEGKITKVSTNTAYIKFDPPAKGSGTVIFDADTDFRECAKDDPRQDCTIDDLKVGLHLDTIGLRLGDRPDREMRATKVLGIQTH